MRTSIAIFFGTGALFSCACASAQTASLTLYGRLNLDIEAVRGRQVDGSNDWGVRLSSNASRLGVRGSESLGGGNSAIFQIESSISADAGGGTLAGRDTFLGLEGGWGTLRLGYMKTPYDAVNAVFGNVPTFLSSILDTESVYGNGTTLSSGGFSIRAPNSVRYDLPKSWGFAGGVQYATLESFGDDAGVGSVGGVWTQGPWQVGGVWQFNHSARDTSTATGLDDHAYAISVAYRFLDRYRVAGVYDRLDYDTPAGSLKRDFWGVSLTVDVGPGQVYAFYANASNGKGGAVAGERVGGLAKGDATGADHYEISYTYALSKRTSVYVGYVKIDNEENASYTFATNPVAIAVGGKPEGFLVGASHNF